MEEKIKNLIQIYKGMEKRFQEFPDDYILVAKAYTYQSVVEDLEKLLENGNSGRDE